MERTDLLLSATDVGEHELMSKDLDFKTVRNIRDLGGYKTKDGRVVKHHLLYRGVNISNLNSDNDIQKFLDLHIKTIFDLRSRDEASSMPDPRIPGTRYIRRPGMIFNGNDTIDFSPDGIARFLRGDLAKQYNMSNNSSPEDVFNLMYRRMLLNRETFSELFDVLLDREVPVYFHCAAGKDRTGAAAILILLSLGVSRQDAIKDYLLTNECYKSKINELYKKYNAKPGQNEDLDAVAERNYTVDASMYSMELDEILEEYGDFDSFFKEYYGLGERELRYLRDTYTEKNVK